MQIASLPYDQLMKKTIFENLIKHISVAELSDAFDISRPAVFQWRLTGIPSNRAAKIEKMISGAIKKEELCPDFSWNA